MAMLFLFLVIEGARRAMRVAVMREEERLDRHLAFLASVGSTSPYIGLFGTVWGIMTSFQGLSDATQATINAVAPGISEALVATAMGLFAAIPAVIAFNKYTSELETISQSTLIFSEELASIFYKQSIKK
jgi:biopolymer transport protein TolQ